MITVFSKFQLRPELTREQAVEEIKETIAWYRGREGCLRKYICLNWEERSGYGVYLWSDRTLAEAFYAQATAEIERQTGATPEILFFDTPVIVDNTTDEVFIDGELVEV
ncbi:MAG: monooxygenase [Ilumatobacter sp.]|uniref:monooxygenase n=1 Tax=Ilumatobacter sp. TaxID=1967498 RepID=UPI00391C80EF